jgi:hypothetical protein
MTLWDRKLRLILPGLAFLIFACEEPGEIGLELNPENGVFVAKYDELDLPSSIILYEDIVSDNSPRIDPIRQNPTSGGRLLVGNFTNQDFGRVESKAFTSMYLGSAGFQGGDFVFDSLILFARVEYLYGENFAGDKRVFIHELSEEIVVDSLYLTKNSTPYIEEPVGEFNFNVSAFDSVRVDTAFTARMSDELGMRLLDRAKTDTLTYNNNVDFREFFKGFAFIPDDANEMVMGIYPESSASLMRMYVHDNADTTYFDFIFQGLDTAGTNITRYYNNITLDRSGTPLAGITDYHTDFETDNDLSYIQASAGVFTKVDLEPYINFLDTLNDFVINRAEIEIPVETYKNTMAPSSTLDLYLASEDNRFIVFTDSASTNFIYNTAGSLRYTKDQNENTGVFVGNVTEYIQDLASGEIDNSIVLLGQTNLWNGVISINQTVIAKDRITLKLYYSTLQ